MTFSGFFKLNFFFSMQFFLEVWTCFFDCCRCKHYIWIICNLQGERLHFFFRRKIFLVCYFYLDLLTRIFSKKRQRMHFCFIYSLLFISQHFFFTIFWLLYLEAKCWYFLYSVIILGIVSKRLLYWFFSKTQLQLDF